MSQPRVGIDYSLREPRMEPDAVPVPIRTGSLAHARIQSRFIAIAFTLSVFTSAALLFVVEPMVGKMVLPLLGGSPAVWTTCMLFFQGALLLGYLYAHLGPRWLGVRRHAVLHIGLLALCLSALPVRLAEVPGAFR